MCVCVWCAYTQQTFLSHKKCYLAICDNMDEPVEHIMFADMSDRERHVLYEFTYMCNLKIN